MSEGSDFPPGKWNLTTHPQETLVCRKYLWKQSENVYYPQENGESKKKPSGISIFLWITHPWKHLFIKYSLEIFTSSLLPSGNAEISTLPPENFTYKVFTLPPEISFIHGGIISINWNSPMR